MQGMQGMQGIQGMQGMQGMQGQEAQGYEQAQGLTDYTASGMPDFTVECVLLW